MNITSKVAASLAAAAGVVAFGCVPATAAVGTPTSFTVDTQFRAAPSDITAATGPLASCTQVTDLENGSDLRTHNQLVFSGVKLLTCGSATVTIGYKAFITIPAFQNPNVIPAGGGFTTHGDWWVLESTLIGVSSGGGKLIGDGRSCTPDEGSGGCVTDAFRGFVS
ncbi:hypothetical protein [Pedococcus bigeumensis]|uniref:Protein activator of alkane oxidation PraB n=1 Tax=Pedococcus bigeumensis TaxID=433644 RepID=A0A502CLC0_9MICO|nr:hypothetical protein [Pedococcus bigeumensis]TPG12919.1 hypothetical protein EAH86_19460 [Pedococcus bigeumensis]